MTNPFAKRQPLPESPKPTPELEISSAVREAIASNHNDDLVITDSLAAPDVPVLPASLIDDSKKLSQLVSDDFPFDESQLMAIRGMSRQQYACLTGAAGTGKTTTTKKLVDTLLNSVVSAYIDMGKYFKSGTVGNPDDEHDDYEVEEKFVPSILMCGFTGRSAQMIKKNFPRDWHNNIMTIHRALAFKPEYYDDWDAELGQMRKKMRFVPTYTAEEQMPWDVVIIDEGGMVGLDLWHQLWAAIKSGARVYIIGDINQLPPVHGRSVFGFAMAKWPSFELTHIHRQVGKNNAIVDNAWRVLQGKKPVDGGNFSMIELKGDAQMASRKVRAIVENLRTRLKIYEPNRDTIITAINGEDGQRGAALGQLPLNSEFALMFNPSNANPRYVIDAGREKKHFAVGDKVMATKNDHEAGITNGMTGVITDIAAHDGYAGDIWRFGIIEEVNARMMDDGASDEIEDFSLEDLNDSMEDFQKNQPAEKDKKERGPASHMVTVQFGNDDEYGFSLTFATLAEVCSLQTAYVMTCHKMQGGESPVVVIICHDVHKQMLYREWLYTAITRASARCILLYTPLALNSAIGKQNIKGRTLAEKVESFNALQTNQGYGVSLKVILPEPELAEGIEDDDIDYGQLEPADEQSLSGAMAESSDSPVGTGLVLVEFKDLAPVGESKSSAQMSALQKALAKASGLKAPPAPARVGMPIYSIRVGVEPEAESEPEAAPTAAERITQVRSPHVTRNLPRTAFAKTLASHPTPYDLWLESHKICEPKPTWQIDKEISDHLLLNQPRLEYKPVETEAKPSRVNPFAKMLKKETK